MVTVANTATNTATNAGHHCDQSCDQYCDQYCDLRPPATASNDRLILSQSARITAIVWPGPLAHFRRFLRPFWSGVVFSSLCGIDGRGPTTLDQIEPRRVLTLSRERKPPAKTASKPSWFPKRLFARSLEVEQNAVALPKSRPTGLLYSRDDGIWRLICDKSVAMKYAH